jgi:hypothetical protein
MAFLMVAGSSEGETQYLWYPVKAVVVAAALVYVWPRLPPLRVASPGLAVLVGLVGFVAWVGLEPFVVTDPEARQGGFDPYVYVAAHGMWTYWVLAGFRMFGFVMVVPVMEEVFWRGFLMRFLINPDAAKVPRPKDPEDIMAWVDYDLERFTNDRFEGVPIGAYSAVSFWGTTLAFASVHGAHWALAMVYGILVGWLFIRTRSIGACIVAHAVTNLALGLYTLWTRQWFWW